LFFGRFSFTVDLRQLPALTIFQAAIWLQGMLTFDRVVLVQSGGVVVQVVPI